MERCLAAAAYLGSVELDELVRARRAQGSWPARRRRVRTLTGITLPRPRRAKQRKRGYAFGYFAEPEVARRTLGVSLPQLVDQLAPYLIGWRGYFGFCDAPRVLANLDAWIRRRLRMLPLAAVAVWAAPLPGTAATRRPPVPRSRRRRVTATGFWRMSSNPAVQQALRNRYFDSVRLPRLAASSDA